ncbi:AglZ/HisF2 family acetamidino modification protein [Aliikangiella coralliicola]|uniref:imidazole glycerol-phosphate synthase n=1 Tax=Aliikangiella coralliicola TaxID=2592383 RepID=A0A545U0K2_9GAMM|nr:AglZ/HisF2 family acetamidino modification protein [Aliikangiella coralliicola]TQV83010.1 imidazole glycerol phosphate synthase subunit HisF [Aliikangiella coralliicola]
MNHRVIPFLGLDSGNLVKTIKFKDPNYIGDPINAIRIFNAKEVDELVIQDIRATTQGNGPNFDLIKDMASEAFMPIAYGGGITSIEQIEKLFKSGVEKVSLNSAALKDPKIVQEASKAFGAQSIVVSIDVKKSFFGKKYIPYTYAGKKKHDLGLQDTLKLFEDQGAGEIIINSIDNDGSMTGVDSSLIEMCSSTLSIPLVYVGGVGSLQDIKNSRNSGASATGVGSMFVYKGPRKAVLISYFNLSES